MLLQGMRDSFITAGCTKKCTFPIWSIGLDSMRRTEAEPDAGGIIRLSLKGVLLGKFLRAALVYDFRILCLLNGNST